MAPSFDHLREADLDDDEFNEDEIDFSDIRERFEVSLEKGYDTFVVVDGLPAVNEEQKPKLVKFLLKKLNSVGKAREDSIYMPMGDDGMSLRLVPTAALFGPCPLTSSQLCLCRVLVRQRGRRCRPLPRHGPPRQEAHPASQQD